MRMCKPLTSVPGLPRFDLPFAFTMVGRSTRSSAPVCYCERKQKVKTVEAWERGYKPYHLSLILTTDLKFSIPRWVAFWDPKVFSTGYIRDTCIVTKNIVFYVDALLS